MYDVMAILGTAGMLALFLVIMAIIGTMMDNHAAVIRKADKP